MKIRQKKNNKAKVHNAKPNTNTAVTPDVIHLPEEVITAAEQVMTNPSLMVGETSALEDNANALEAFNAAGSEYLLQAAKDPGAALRDYHEDIPVQTDAELTASLITQQAEEAEFSEVEVAETEERPIITALLATPTDAPERDFANTTYRIVSEGSEQLLITAKMGVAYVERFFRHTKNRIVVLADHFWDFVKKLGNDAWALYDAKKAEYRKRTIDKQAEFVTSVVGAVLEPLDEAVAKASEVFEAEMRRISKRMTDLENQLRRSTKSQNNVVNSLSGRIKQAEGIDPELVKQFAASLLSGRKANTVSLYRALTGVDLATAKVAIEAIVAA